MNRCVNIDWLEVYCLEPKNIYGDGIIDVQYLQNLKYTVKARNFGTPSYNEVLTVAFLGEADPAFEIRRRPRKDSQGGSFLDTSSCHIRLTNKWCYCENPIITISDFLVHCGYTFKSIKRVDICMDFNYFDRGDDPKFILRDYITEKLAKINQSKVSAHGADSWSDRSWNSIRWGSPSSNISTRFYNKSLEMRQVKMKSYIQDYWIQCGLDISKDVWRVEFEIKAGQRGFKNIQSQEFYKMKLDFFNSRSKLLFLFHILAKKYFHFKYREKNDDGSYKRKDRCKDKVLFVTSEKENLYTPHFPKFGNDPTRMDRILMNRCYKLSEDPSQNATLQTAAKMVAEEIYKSLNGYIY